MIDLNNHKLELEYPCSWCYKIVIAQDRNGNKIAKEIFEDRDHKVTKSNVSKNGKFKSLNVEIEVHSDEDRTGFHKKAWGSPPYKNGTLKLNNLIYENELIKIEIEEFEIPWLKIFTQKNYKEFSQCDQETKLEILRCLDIIEKEMLQYFQPDKINIASFGNYVPHVHFHIQARFKNDSYFPESTWGKKQRIANLTLDNFDSFYQQLILKLK